MAEVERTLANTVTQKRIGRLLYRYLLVIGTLALFKLALTPFEPYLAIQLIALLYLLPVMLSTVLWGFTPGILAGFIGFLIFNFFYIVPYYTFEVHQTQDLITLFIFLMVAFQMSRLIGKAREGMRIAQSREWEATHMYELISALAGLQNASSIAQTLADHILATFELDRVQIEISGEEAYSAHANGRDEWNGTGAPSMKLNLNTSRGVEGQIALWHKRTYIPQEESRLLGAYINQGALSLERARLANIETRAKILEESDQVKSALLNSVSHELRSPLAAIKASASSLRSGTVDWNLPARQDLLATIDEEADHLNLLVGNLLDMSRIESGALSPNIHWNSIAEIVMGVAVKMRKLTGAHMLEFDFPDDLPLVPTDYAMIEQVFNNLISNSVKYAPAGTTIKIGAEVDGDDLHVRVSNQGPQVAEEHLEKIFEKFHRVTEADRITGTGLGLSICKGIVEAHGGRIWARNEADMFVFHLSLPLKHFGKLPDIPEELA